MPAGEDGSVTAWIGDLKAGGDDAAQRLWERYFEQLVQLARKRLRGATCADCDEEDAALSAFDSFCRGVKNGRFPRLDDRDDLWRILVVLTQRKVADQVRHEMTLRRGGGKVHGEVTDMHVDVFDREKEFITRHLTPLVKVADRFDCVLCC